MLAAAHRLRRSKEFAAAVRGGRRASRGSVVVHLTVPQASETDRSAPLPSVGSSPASATRAGFVVSKAVGGAVVRNRVRRRLRHLLADRIHRLPGGATIIVRAQPAAALASYAELGAHLDAALAAARAPHPRAIRTVGR